MPNVSWTRRPRTLTGRPGFVILVIIAVASVAGCGGRSTVSPAPTPVASPIRGTEETADSVAEQDRLAVYRHLLRSFYRPTGGQARWIDTRPLGEKRGAADSIARAMSDDEMPPDAGLAESVVQASGLRRVCVLGGAEDDCRGRKGGVLRFSPVYALGPDRVHVFARYTPHGGAMGPTTELRFTLERRGSEWRIVEETTVM